MFANAVGQLKRFAQSNALRKEATDKNPELKAFFAAFSLSLGDINEQNTKMKNGEKSQADIERHVDQWIAKNQKLWNDWLELARTAAKQSSQDPAAKSGLFPFLL